MPVRICARTKDRCLSLDALHRTCSVGEREVIRELIHPLRRGTWAAAWMVFNSMMWEDGTNVEECFTFPWVSVSSRTTRYPPTMLFYLHRTQDYVLRLGNVCIIIIQTSFTQSDIECLAFYVRWLFDSFLALEGVGNMYGILNIASHQRKISKCNILHSPDPLFRKRKC